MEKKCINFDTVYSHRYMKPEENSGKNKVERAGYQVTERMVKNFLLAGQNLTASRREEFDYGPDDKDDGYTDPTRDPDFDDVDAQGILERLVNDAEKDVGGTSGEIGEKKEDGTPQNMDGERENVAVFGDGNSD